MKTFSFFRKALCCLFVLGIAFSSCSDADTKYDKEINDINKEIQSFKDQLGNLSKNAYITDIKALEDGSGFIVTKSDGKPETIKVKGEKGEQGEAGKPGLVLHLLCQLVQTDSGTLMVRKLTQKHKVSKGNQVSQVKTVWQMLR